MPLDPELQVKLAELKLIYVQILKDINILSYRKLFWQENLLHVQCSVSNELSLAQNTKQILDIFGHAISYQNKNLTKVEILRKNNQSWFAWLFLGLVVCLTAPLSLPVLFYHSMKHRGTLYFWKTTSAILVDDISTYCATANTPSENQPLLFGVTNMQESQETTMVSYSSQENTSTPLIRNEPLISDSILQLGSTLASINMSSFFATMARQQYLSNRGIPLIGEASFDFTNEDTFFAHIRCGFQSTNACIDIDIELLKTFKLPPSYRPIKKIASLNIIPPKRGYFQRLFESPPTFESLLEKAQQPALISRIEKACRLAYCYAENDAQRVLILETLINQFHRIYLMRQKDGSSSIVVEDMLNKINTYLSYLPENYTQSCETATEVDSRLHYIYQLIALPNLDDAWGAFQALPPLSYFIQIAFPNLLAMKKQLTAIFLISKHKNTDGTMPLCDIYRAGLIRSCLKQTSEILDKFDPQAHNCINNAIDTINGLEKTGKQISETRDQNPEVALGLNR